jgi:hypothetical protein
MNLFKLRTVSGFIIIFVLALLIGCAEKTVSLVDGTMITQRKYDKLINNAFKKADKAGRKAVRGKMSRKQIRDFKNTPVDLVFDTIPKQ